MALAGVLLIYASFLAQQRQTARQDREIEEQRDLGRKQLLESSLFQLLNLQSQIVTAMQATEACGTGPTRAWHGRDCFPYFYRRLKQHYTDRKAAPFIAAMAGFNDDPKPSPEAQVIEGAYEKFHAEQQKDLAHYFTHLYQIIKYIDLSELKEADKKRYTGLVRAQLSAYEVVLLFYNCLSSNGYDDFKPLVEKYGLLHLLNTDLLFDKSHEGEDFYDPSARK